MSLLGGFVLAMGSFAAVCSARALWFFWKGWRMFERQERVSEREAAMNGAPLSSAVLSVAPRRSAHRVHRGF